MRVYCVQITGITKIRGKRIFVKTKAGKEVALPKSQTQFAPGRVVIPWWLATKMADSEPVDRYFS